MENIKLYWNKFLSTIYKTVNGKVLKKPLLAMDKFLEKKFGKVYWATLGRIKLRMRYSASRMKYTVSENSFKDICWKYDKVTKSKGDKLVSIIVPNYNHAQYLRERLDSIYNQTYKNYEVILLDDCSTDNSRDILDEYAKKYPDRTRTIYNEKNCGNILEQWNRGIENAGGELIWIAESDDYCKADFLEKLVGYFASKAVFIAFARSEFMREGVKTWSTEEYLADLEMMRWDKPFIMSANNAVKHGFAIHNIIPNVSSAVFRNTGGVSDEVKAVCKDMKLSSDWIFYLNLIKGGLIAYTNETTNYYRIHVQSTSLNVQKTDMYYREFARVSEYIAENYKIDVKVFHKILDNLKEHYMTTQKVKDATCVEEWYQVEKLKAHAQLRKPNIMICAYAMKSGGGETYPMMLANEMKRQGATVTFVNFNMAPEEEGIERLINRDVPVVNLKGIEFAKHISVQLGIDVVHSHHACVDEELARGFEVGGKYAKHIITLHGMYESIEPMDCERVIKKTWDYCDRYIYIADKNLLCFKQYGYEITDKFIKLPNGIPEVSVTPVKRAALGLSEDDFVIVIASRGLPQKGWLEAAEAVQLANAGSGRRVKLVILGDGQAKAELEKRAYKDVLLLGTVPNVRDYFAMSDCGMLPTYFSGESYPLVVMECLMAGKPMIVTDIAETRNQLAGKNGLMAGILINLKDGKVLPEDIAEAICTLRDNPDRYQEIYCNVESIRKKFNIEDIVKQHFELYEKCVKDA